MYRVQGAVPLVPLAQLEPKVPSAELVPKVPPTSHCKLPKPKFLTQHS